jgi:hypothetical protein
MSARDWQTMYTTAISAGTIARFTTQQPLEARRIASLADLFLAEICGLCAKKTEKKRSASKWQHWDPDLLPHLGFANETQQCRSNLVHLSVGSWYEAVGTAVWRTRVFSIFALRWSGVSGGRFS